MAFNSGFIKKKSFFAYVLLGKNCISESNFDEETRLTLTHAHRKIGEIPTNYSLKLSRLTVTVNTFTTHVYMYAYIWSPFLHTYTHTHVKRKREEEEEEEEERERERERFTISKNVS